MATGSDFQAPSAEARVVSIELSLPRSVVAMSGERTSDQAFIEALFAQHHVEIYGFLARMVRDDELAADLAQETFVKAFRALDTLESPERARAWLFQIASHTALDELRRRRVIRFVPWTGESRGTAPSAEDTAMRGRLSGEMARALDRIPDRQRLALILAEVNGLTGTELAAALGVTHVAARALLSRARESLRTALLAERHASGGLRRAAGESGSPAHRTDGAAVAQPRRSEERR
jgi:RNA polymerase sigma-70 factor, ECF subfamily